MRFVAANTSIPVPKVYCSFIHKGQVFIVMERIRGDPLGHVWNSFREESRTKILAQLAQFVQELRALSPPEDMGIANVDRGALYDGRLVGGSPNFGPFKTTQEFHKFLRNGLTRQPGYDSEIDHMMELQDGPWPPPVFTHGDLSSLNVLVRGDELVGIIDWETSGWYCPYWEYTTACQVNPRNPFWREQIDRFLNPMPKEFAMDQVRLKYFGDT